MAREVRCHLKREYDFFHPTSKTVCESISLSIESPDRDDRFLQEWYITGDSHSGRILIDISDPAKENQERIKQIFFEDAVCFSIGESFASDSVRRIINLNINCEKVRTSDTIL